MGICSAVILCGATYILSGRKRGHLLWSVSSIVLLAVLVYVEIVSTERGRTSMWSKEDIQFMYTFLMFGSALLAGVLVKATGFWSDDKSKMRSNVAQQTGS
jgi:hypothetical protein